MDRLRKLRRTLEHLQPTPYSLSGSAEGSGRCPAHDTGGGRRGPGGCQRRRGAEARQVDGDDGPAGGESVDDRVPDAHAPAGSAEEQQGLTRAAHLVVQNPLHGRNDSDHLGRSLPASNAQVTTIVDLGIRLVDGRGSVECMKGVGGRKGGSFVSFNWQETREQRDRFIRAVYDLRDPNTGWAVGDAIMQRMGFDPENTEDEARYFEIARYWDELATSGGKPADSA